MRSAGLGLKMIAVVAVLVTITSIAIFAVSYFGFRDAWIVIVFLILISCISFAWWINIYILKPLKEITMAVSDFSNGNPDRLQNIKETNDEIGTLASAFINLSDNMKDTTEKMLTEIAERIKNEKALQESESYIQTIIQQMDNGLIVASAEGDILMVNNAVSSMFGYALEELVGKPVEMLMEDKVALNHKKYLKNFFEENKIKVRGVGRELSGKRKDGSTFPINLSVTQALYQQEIILVGSIQDITEQKSLEKYLMEANANAEAGIEAKSTFLATMSHEIRTPLNGVLGVTELLSETALTQDQVKYVETIKHYGDVLLHLINDILDFTKFETGNQTLEMKKFDTRDSVSRILNIFEFTSKKKGVSLILECSDDVPDFLVGDITRLQQVLVNLIGNAVKFTEHGSITVTMSLSKSDQNACYVKFEIIDTGIGIHPDAVQQIFHPFQQADTSTTRRFGGTGLGLAICKQVVELMSGKLKVSSVLGEGTTFTFDVKLRRAEFAEYQILNDPSVLESNVSIDGLEYPDEGASKISDTVYSVLLVEDNAVNQKVAKKMLESMNCHVTLAENGIEAIAVAERNTFDIVFMDCQMPKMDGYTATEKIRLFEGPKCKVPVIALTANAMEGDKERCLDAGMSDYLTKPVRKHSLRAMLDKWL